MKPAFPVVNNLYAIAKHAGYFGKRTLGMDAPFEY
jgi:hypothetical protein